MRKLRKNSRPYAILKYLALGSGIVIVSLAAPTGGAKIINALIAAYFRKKRFERYRFLSDLKNLQARELIRYEELGGGTVRIELTAHGKKQTLEYDIDNIQLTLPHRWDRVWRLVMFDIPHDHKVARDAFRTKLEDLKFYSLQKACLLRRIRVKRKSSLLQAYSTYGSTYSSST